MYQRTLQDVTYQATQYLPSTSSRVEEGSIREVLDNTIQGEAKVNIGLSILFLCLEIDRSSVWPRFEKDIVTSPVKIIKEVEPEEMLEYDVVVRIPPKRTYAIQMRVEDIKKGEPIIVEPEDILEGQLPLLIHRIRRGL